MGPAAVSLAERPRGGDAHHGSGLRRPEHGPADRFQEQGRRRRRPADRRLLDIERPSQGGLHLGVAGLAIRVLLGTAGTAGRAGESGDTNDPTDQPSQYGIRGGSRARLGRAGQTDRRGRHLRRVLHDLAARPRVKAPPRPPRHPWWSARCMARRALLGVPPNGCGRRVPRAAPEPARQLGLRAGLYRGMHRRLGRGGRGRSRRLR